MNAKAFFKKYSFAAILLAAFFFRFFLFLALEPWEAKTAERLVSPSFDSFDYHTLAQQILEKKSFENFYDTRTPGYPVFLAILYSIFGVKIWAVQFAQILLDLASGIFIYFIAKEIFHSKSISSFAFFLYAIDPLLAILSLQIMTETFFIFLFTFVIFLFVRYVKDELNRIGVKYMLGIGALLGFATLVRPAFVYLPWLIFLIIILQKKQFIYKAKHAAAFLLMFYLVISLWQARNFSVYGYYDLSSVSGSHLISYFAGTVKGKLEGIDSVLATEELSRGAEDINNPFEKSAFYKKISINYIQKHPLAYGYYHVKLGILPMLFDTARTNIFDTFGFREEKEPAAREETSLARAGRVWANFGKDFYLDPILFLMQIIEYIFAAIGLYFVQKDKKIIAIFFLAIIFYNLLVYGTGGLVRYRAPVVPLYLILSGYGFYLIIRRIKSLFLPHKYPVEV